MELMRLFPCRPPVPGVAQPEGIAAPPTWGHATEHIEDGPRVLPVRNRWSCHERHSIRWETSGAVAGGIS